MKRFCQRAKDLFCERSIHALSVPCSFAITSCYGSAGFPAGAQKIQVLEHLDKGDKSRQERVMLAAKRTNSTDCSRSLSVASSGTQKAVEKKHVLVDRNPRNASNRPHRIRLLLPSGGAHPLWPDGPVTDPHSRIAARNHPGYVDPAGGYPRPCGRVPSNACMGESRSCPGLCGGGSKRNPGSNPDLKRAALRYA